MPRKSRKNHNSSFFHIMVQGINREHIFYHEENKEKYRNIITKSLSEMNKTKLNILSYCIMSNHTHFLFFVDNIELLSKFMHQINTKYGSYYNKQNNRVGFVFRDRFKVQEIMNMHQLYNCLRYIHNNPVKAKYCENMGDYKYSSYNEFNNKRIIINDIGIQQLFGTTENFNEIFDLIHQTYNDNEDSIFLEDKSLEITKFTEIFCRENHVGFSDIKNRPALLESYIKQAKQQTNISLDKLSNLLSISKYKVRYYYKN